MRGTFGLIQSKAYDPGYAITKRDIDTFLSASSTAGFSFRLLIATTDLIGANAKRTIDSQEKPVHLQMRSDLAASAVEWPVDPGDLQAAASCSQANPAPTSGRPSRLW